MGGPLSRTTEAYKALFDRMDIDGIFFLAPPCIGPEITSPADCVLNEWGMGTRKQRYATGTYDEQVRFPLAEAETIDDLEAYPWPSPDWYDYGQLPAAAEMLQGRALGCGYSAIFYFHNKLRGLELSLTDPFLKPDFTRHLLQKLSDFFYEYHRRCFEATQGLVDMTQVTDDFGSQHGLIVGPDIFDTYYRPHLQRAIDLAKSYELLVFHHDDGDVRPLLPVFVAMGIDVLNPIQWRCGDWDLHALKKDYGAALCFHSAVDNQQTLAHGTPDDVRAEVRHLIDTLASDCTGFIVGPCHNLQAITPVENILALYEMAHEYGAF